MLENDRLYLKNSLFKMFISEDTKPIFNTFLDKVFKKNIKESCDVKLLTKNNLLTYVHITGIVLKDKEECFVNILDMTEKIKDEEEIKSLSRFPSEDPNPVLRIDSKGFVIYANSASLEIFSDIKSKSVIVIPEFIKEPLFKAIISNKKIEIEKNIKIRIFSFQLYQYRV